jgi:hypothetical protein
MNRWRITIRDANGDNYICPFDSYAAAQAFMEMIADSKDTVGVAWLDIRDSERWTMLNIANIVSVRMEES